MKVKRCPELFYLLKRSFNCVLKCSICESAYPLSCRSNFSSPPGPQFPGNGPPPQFAGGADDMQGANMLPPGTSCPSVPAPGSPSTMACPPHPHIGPPMSPPGASLQHGFHPGPAMHPPAAPGQAAAFHTSPHGNRPNANPPKKQQGPFSPGADLPMQQNVPYPAMGQNRSVFYDCYYGSQSVGQEVGATW